MARRKKRERYGDYCEARGNVLYGRVSVPVGNGKYKIKRKKVSSRIEARQWAQQELDRMHGETDLETFLDLAEWYKEHFLVEPVYERGHRVQGVRDHQKSRNKLDRMCEHFGLRPLLRISERDLLAYCRHRREKDKVATATINRDLALLRTMFRKAREAGIAINLPRFPINAAAEVERERVMTQDEEARILAACTDLESREFVRRDTGTTVKTNKHKTNRSHLRAIIIIAVDTAMRAGEIFSLEWSDVDFESGTITIQAQKSKTKKSRKVGMTSRVRKELEAIRNGGEKVFAIRSVYKSFNTACERAKIKNLRFHDLRHTATTRMIRAGIPHTEVMKITGHTQMKTFLRYLNLVDDTVQNAASQLDSFLAGMASFSAKIYGKRSSDNRKKKK